MASYAIYPPSPLWLLAPAADLLIDYTSLLRLRKTPTRCSQRLHRRPSIWLIVDISRPHVSAPVQVPSWQARRDERASTGPTFPAQPAQQPICRLNFGSSPSIIAEWRKQLTGCCLSISPPPRPTRAESIECYRRNLETCCRRRNKSSRVGHRQVGCKGRPSSWPTRDPSASLLSPSFPLFTYLLRRPLGRSRPARARAHTRGSAWGDGELEWCRLAA